MTLSFLPVKLEHAALCAALDGECFTSSAFSEDMLTSLLQTPYVFGFLALIGERPIGYSLASSAGMQGDLLSISIIPEMQGKGYGHQSMDKILKAAKVIGITEIFLEVRPSNLPAIKLYKKFGGKQTGIRKNYYVHELTGHKEDALVFNIPI